MSRLHLTYGDGAGAGPDTVIAKCQSLHAENIVLSQMMGFYTREVRFYNDLSARLDSPRVPHCYHASMEEGGAPFVLLLEDIVGATTSDQIEGTSRERTFVVLETVAALHAKFWGDGVLALDWVPPMNNDMYKGAAGLAEANWDGFVEKWGDRLPADAVEWSRQLTAKYPEMLDWWAEASPQTLTHTDCRTENYLWGGPAGPEAVTMVDFQLMTRHIGTYDVANFLGMSITTEDRRAWEREALEHYHATLVAHGVQGYDFDQCWRDYRYCLMQQAWAQVAVANLDPGNDRGRALLDAFVTRSFAAASENNAGEVLEEF